MRPQVSGSWWCFRNEGDMEKKEKHGIGYCSLVRSCCNCSYMYMLEMFVRK